MKCKARIARIRSVHRQYRLAAAAFDELSRAMAANPSHLRAIDLGPADLRVGRRNLEPTYLVRLFAEFETGLRDAWALIARDTHPPTRALLDGVSARRSIPEGVRISAHMVREYRNSLVHEESAKAKVVAIGEATDFLCRFFSFLPPDW